MTGIAPCLWFNGDAEAAARLYVAVFPNSSIGAISRYGEGARFPAGTALMAEFTLNGQRFQALNGGPEYRFSEAVSFSVPCADQAEVDHYWNALTSNGGAPGRAAAELRFLPVMTWLVMTPAPNNAKYRQAIVTGRI